MSPYSMHRYPYSQGFDGQVTNLDGDFDPDATQDGLWLKKYIPSLSLIWLPTYVDYCYPN